MYTIAHTRPITPRATKLKFVIDGDRNPAAANGSSVQGGAGLPDLLDSRQSSTRTGAWLTDTYRLGNRGSIEAGLRLDRAGINGETTLSPRLSAVITLAPKTTLRSGNLVLRTTGMAIGYPGKLLFRADPIRIYSLPTGAISINSILASNITQTGARITLGLTR